METPQEQTLDKEKRALREERGKEVLYNFLQTRRRQLLGIGSSSRSEVERGKERAQTAAHHQMQAVTSGLA